MAGDSVPSAEADRGPGAAGAHDPADPVANAVANAQRLGRRAAHGLILVVAVVFIGSSAWQIVHAIFVESAAASAPPALDPGCANGVRRLVGALDRAADHAVSSAEQPATTRPEDVVALFRHQLSPEWDGAGDVERRCAASAAGADAWAALQRLRSAQEQLARQSRAELAPLRHDLAAHLPAELR
jgi:hypothetical protein